MTEELNGRWSRLIDEKEMTRRRKDAENRYRDLGTDQIAYLRKRAKTDLFFLAYGILGYDLLSEKLHGDICLWFERTRKHRYRMLLIPRDHYKSTVCTISESVQMALPNDAGVQDWPYCLGPDIKLLLAHENRESASRFLIEVAEAFMSKPLMLALFPDCIPGSRKQRINKWELELPREAHHKEPTFDTIGAGGAAQGRHYNHLKLDDIVGESARDSPTVMQTVTDWFDNVNSLLTRLKIDGWDLIGTRWSVGDIYGHAERKYGVDKKVSVLNAYNEAQIKKLPDGVLAAYVRSAVEDGKPIFPEEFDLADLDLIRKNPKVWAAQYANNPVESGLTTFKPGWLKYYNVGEGGKLYVFAGETSWSVRTWDLDRVIMVDPSVGENDKSDESAIVVTGTDEKLNVYVLETIKKRLKPPELVDLLLQLYVKWSPRTISMEEVIFSATYRYWLQERAKEMRLNPSIYSYKPGGRRSKLARIEGLTNYFASGQVYIMEGMYDFREEFEQFPLTNSDHLLDALAQGPEVWSPGLKEKDFERFRAAEAAIMEDRDIVTGY